MLKLKLKHIIGLIIYAIPNTLLNFAILYIINNAISGNSNKLSGYNIGLVFVSIIAITYLLNIIFQKYINKYSFNLLYKNEKRVFNKILKTPLETLENLGSQRFYTVIEDLRIFSTLPEILTHSMNSIMMLLICIAYLLTLSITAGLVVIGVIVVMMFIYFFAMNVMSEKVNQLRNYNEYYYRLVEDVIKGFKGFKLSVFRRNKLMKSFLSPNRDKAEKLDFKINYVFLSISLISQYGLYLIIGGILFILPEFGILERNNVISYVVVLLFIIGPINDLINMQNIYTRLIVANSRIKTFMDDFSNEEEVVENSKNTVFDSLEFKDVCFTYEKENKGDTFVLGPLNLSIKKGETIFVVGGNGSGKSTFVNLLTGLYKKTKGSIILNEREGVVNATDIQNMISAVFTDNYIYSSNYDNYSLENNLEYDELLSVMELNEVVTDNKEKSARRIFSKGQSKRMSLILALLEKKPILVLDEWAADQDPYFRKKFYENLLPQLKEEGKTIVAVTHDDTYFKYADRIIKFDYGNIVLDVEAKNNTSLETVF
ncbi:cyclic peptide export ABC transporter [Tenacibaculum xiamenense]|uniref:cyclic peptide export ABC transporter n=1 Tax=Tenacibaculum xiamenense TaxID=1261553 RepID=UPI0038953D8A